jgi:hypothetical protein
MDVYGNLRGTLARLRTLHNRKSKGNSNAVTSDAKGRPRRGGRGRGGNTTLSPPILFTPEMEMCLSLTDISGFVHVNLIATHPHYRGRGLAKMLITAELLRWALRGRKQVYVNMALDKQLVEHDSRVVCVVPPASKRLYDVFQFLPVLPTAATANGHHAEPDEDDDDDGGVVTLEQGQQFSAREKDSGRVLCNLNFVPLALNVAAEITTMGASVTPDGGGGGRRVVGKKAERNMIIDALPLAAETNEAPNSVVVLSPLAAANVARAAASKSKKETNKKPRI